MEKTFLFTPGKVSKNKVKLKEDTVKGEFRGLCLKNNIRVYFEDITKEFDKIRSNTQAKRDLKRNLYAHTDDFVIDDDHYLELRNRTSSDYTKEYVFTNGIYLVYSKTFIDIVESGRLEEYMLDYCFDINEAPRIKKEKALMLSRLSNSFDDINFTLK